MRKTAVIAAALLAACLPSASLADGIGTLVEAAKSMDGAKKVLASEEASFNAVRDALESGALKKGDARDAVLGRYGAPVVMNEDFATKRERWVYKSPGASFFKGARIVLLFDRNGRLDEIKVSQ